MTPRRPMPTRDDVLGYFDSLSNWGRWGDDEPGTLNHITDGVRPAPARAVRLGRSVSCGWAIAVPAEVEGCATTAAELGQWDSHLAVAPIRFAGTSGSPVNPIATF